MLSGKYFLFVVATILLVYNEHRAFGFRTGLGRNGNYNQQQYRSNYYQASSNVAGTSNQGSARSPDQEIPEADGIKSSSKGLPAWGIIAIVIGIILLGTGGYYAFVFYPYICKKERNYDMIELTNVL